MARTLVTFHAHPDDEALFTSGTMAKAAAEGHRVVLVVATAGEVGDADASFTGTDGGLGAARRAELERSAAVLGVHRLELLGYRDSGLDGTAPAPEGGPVAFARADVDEAAERLAVILREEQADVLTGYDVHGGYGHADHRQVHRVAARAAELAGTPVLLEATISRDLMQLGVELAAGLGYEVPPNLAPESFDAFFVPADEITHAVDVSSYLPQKRASMEAHASQSTSAGGGDRTIGLFLSLPEEYFALGFATEWFRQPGAPVSEPKLDDVFAGLD